MSNRRKLVARRRQLIKELCTQSTLTDEFDFQEELRDIESYDKLIKYATPSYRSALVASAVALLCVTIVGIAWTWPISNSELIVSLEAEAVELRLANSWEWRNLPAKQSALRLEQMSRVEVPTQAAGRVPPTILKGSPWLDLQKGLISINGLTIEQEAVIRIHRADDGFVYVHTLGAPMSGHVSVLGDALEIEAGDDRIAQQIDYAVNRPVPESLVFASEGVGMIPAVLRMRPSEPLVLANLDVNRMTFARQVSERPGDTEFACMIKSGTVHFNDIDQISSLENGDCLSMRGAFGHVVEITVSDKILMKFEGTAEQVEIGPEGFQRDITPTYLEWLYHNQRLSFLWGVVVFLWGMLWSLRKVFTS